MRVSFVSSKVLSSVSRCSNPLQPPATILTRRNISAGACTASLCFLRASAADSVIVIDMAFSEWLTGWADRKRAALYQKYSRQKGPEKSKAAGPAADRDSFASADPRWYKQYGPLEGRRW